MKTIEAEELARSFGTRLAVAGLTFSVDEGEIFGFLGPNGAGKTTTIRLLTGQLAPSAGTARVVGCDVALEQATLVRRVGVVFEEQNHYERMTGRENLRFFARLHGVAAARVDEVLAEVDLGARADDRVATYSNGMKQRLSIARAVLHRPKVLFLDEPTRGLDPTAAAGLRAHVRRLAADGTSVFLTTHYMEEADALCRRVAFVNEGRVVALDEPLRLKVAHGRREVRVNLAAGGQEVLPLGTADGARRLAELCSTGSAATVHSGEATLEEVFVALTGRGLEP